jgi:hypothetical protein
MSWFAWQEVILGHLVNEASMTLRQAAEYGTTNPVGTYVTGAIL